MIKVLHIFTEEPSARIVFDTLLPRILPADVAYRVYSHQGKQDLEIALQRTLPSISKIPGSRILITRDQDSEDCLLVKRRIVELVQGRCHCQFSVRIVCRELEAWFLGDLDALQAAYPRFRPNQYINKADFRNVDRITTPSRYLLNIIPEFSGRTTLPKLETSESISSFMEVERNQSESFKHTFRAIMQLIAN